MVFALSMRGTPPRASARSATEPGADGTRTQRRFIWRVIVPTDGTNAARVTNENFGTFSFYGSSRASYGVPVLAYLWCWDVKHNSA